MRNMRSVIFVFTLLAFAVVAACGSENQESDAVTPSDKASATDSIGSENSQIVTSSTNYSIDDFVAVGYKAVTQFELETLPGATDAWYGFFSQKDIELRFYESHSAALKQGVAPAEVAVNKGAVGYSKQPPRRFEAYAVVGNVVMLCELELESCELLIDVLD